MVRSIARKRAKEAITNGERFRAHAFEYICATNVIEHRTTRARHPWTNGQVERMNRTIKDATVKRFYYESHDQLGNTSPTSSQSTTSPAGSRPSRASRPYEFICKAWTSQPERFTTNPLQQMPGSNS
jgi:transposase InsO family protein